MCLLATLGLDDDQQMLYQTAYDFGQNEMLPNAEKWDEEEIFPEGVLRQLVCAVPYAVQLRRIPRRCPFL